MHLLGQTLIVISGAGWVQRDGGPTQAMWCGLSLERSTGIQQFHRSLISDVLDGLPNNRLQ
jgi:hypothetical protein